MNNKIYDSIIIGAGPSGISCALKLKEAGLDFLLIEGSMPGGKVNIAPRVDNYPGKKEIPGPDLAYWFFERLQNSGINHEARFVTSLTKENDLFVVTCEDEKYLARTIYIASGTKERKIGLPLEDEMLGHGLSYCALCDGHFFKGQRILVVGGGNSALKEAIHLSHIASHLTLIHRRNQFRGNEKLVDELRKQDNVEILTPYIPLEIIASDHIEAIKIQNVETKEERIIETEGFFPLVGQIPNTQFIHIDGVVDEWGTIPVDKTHESSAHNLFAGGDVLPRPIRQIYLAEHDGMVASASIINRIKEIKGE